MTYEKQAVAAIGQNHPIRQLYMVISGVDEEIVAKAVL